MSCFKYNVLKWDSELILERSVLPKLLMKSKNASNETLINQLRGKNSVGADVYLPQEWIQGASKIDFFEIIYFTEMGK